VPTRVRLPDGLVVNAANRFEANVLYREMFVERSYFRHGITLPPDGCVVDVGANIGMFALFLARHHPGLTVHMLEPLPSTFALLERNLAEAAAGPRFRAHRLGLSREAGTAAFELDPEGSFAASMRPDVVLGSMRPGAGPDDWAEAVLLDLPRVFPDSALARGASASLRHAWSRRPALLAARLALAAAERGKAARLRTVVCPVTRLSDFLRAQEIEAVQLLKIDVEGAEMDVIEGIDERDWPRVEQLVVEVHDQDGRVERLAGLLRARGFSTVTEPEEWAIHRLLGITTLFARR
jgi:hypothetical protein